MGRKNLVFYILMAAFASGPLYGESNAAAAPAGNAEDSTAAPAAGTQPDAAAPQAEELIGLLPSEVFERIGAPEAVYPMRGESQWQDDVIFYYSSHLYLFFYDNRVWQVRGDHRFGGKILGVRAGMKRDETRAALGRPDSTGDDGDIYLNPAGITRLEKGFPLRMRLLFSSDDRLYDIYLYRGDY